jgi:hypothetical protein
LLRLIATVTLIGAKSIVTQQIGIILFLADVNGLQLNTTTGKKLSSRWDSLHSACNQNWHKLPDAALFEGVSRYSFVKTH